MPTTSTPALNRIGNILKPAILTRSASETGHDVFNLAAIPHSLLNAALSNTYQPAAQRTDSASAERFAWSRRLHGTPELNLLGRKLPPASPSFFRLHK
jgi:hypothetical protein